VSVAAGQTVTAPSSRPSIAMPAATRALCSPRNLNGDGRVDLAAATATGDTISVLLGDRRPVRPPARSTASLPMRPTRASLAEGRGATSMGTASSTLVNVNQFSNTVSVLLGKRRRHFPERGEFTSAGQKPRSRSPVGDFNGDGKQDSGGCQRHHQRHGKRAVGQRRRHLPERGDPIRLVGILTTVATGDFNGDGKLDLLTTNTVTGERQPVLLGNGDGTFQKPRLTMPPVFRPDLTVAADGPERRRQGQTLWWPTEQDHQCAGAAGQRRWHFFRNAGLATRSIPIPMMWAVGGLQPRWPARPWRCRAIKSTPAAT